jgi:hypothetical protein
VDPAEVYEIQSGKDDGKSIASTRAWLEARASDPACAGVYALYDRDERMQFVGYRRDVRAAVAGATPRSTARTRRRSASPAFANRATATRANLRAEADRWIREWVDARGGEETEIPRGNLAVGAAEWTLAPEPWEEEAAVVPGAMNAGGGRTLTLTLALDERGRRCREPVRERGGADAGGRGAARSEPRAQAAHPSRTSTPRWRRFGRTFARTGATWRWWASRTA